MLLCNFIPFLAAQPQVSFVNSSRPSTVLTCCCRGGDPSLGDVYSHMTPPVTKDQWHIHDPSRLVATDGLLMLADTAKAQEDGYK